MEAAPAPQKTIQQETHERLSKVLLQRTINHQIFLCSMIGPHLDLEMVYKMSKMNISKIQFANSFRKKLLEWRSNTNFMKKQYIKSEYFRIFRHPTTHFNIDLKLFIKDAYILSSNFCEGAHVQFATNEFECILSQIMKQQPHSIQGKGALKDIDIYSDKNIWSFKQINFLCFGLLSQIHQGMSWLQLTVFLPLKRVRQIKRIIKKHFGIKSSLKRKLSQQQQESLKEDIAHQLQNIADCCYYMRGMSHQRILEDYQRVVAVSNKDEKPLGMKIGKCLIQQYLLANQSKLCHLGQQKSNFNDQYTSISAYLDGNNEMELEIKPNVYPHEKEA